jgi:hypothetical protein
MIKDSYDLVIGIYLAVIAFFAGYMLLGNDKIMIMRSTSLNWIFMAFFIMIFFLFGYLFKNLLMQFKDVRKKIPTNYINKEMES